MIINIINIITKVENVMVLFNKILRMYCGIYRSAEYSPFPSIKYWRYNSRDVSHQFFYHYLPELQHYR